MSSPSKKWTCRGIPKRFTVDGCSAIANCGDANLDKTVAIPVLIKLGTGNTEGIKPSGQ